VNNVQDKVVVVTGAGSGFGKLTSEKLARLRAKVVLADVNPDTVQAVTDGIRAEGGTAACVVTDVAVQEQVERMAGFAVSTFGRLDVLINNAGIMPLSLFASKRVDAWDRCIDINLKGAVYGIAAVIDIMIAQGEGHVVNVSSLYANHTHAGVGIYSATKAGLKMISDALRAETRGIIKVSTIYPSGAATNLGSTVIDFSVLGDFWGKHTPEFMEALATNPGSTTTPDMTDRKALVLSADAVADAIVYCVNQPKGITISDILIRASNEAMIY